MSKSVFWSKFVNPDDGYAYSKVELAGLWELPVRVETVIHQRENRFAFFTHCAAKFGQDLDKALANMIARATIAEVMDPEPINTEESVPGCFALDPKAFEDDGA